MTGSDLQASSASCGTEEARASSRRHTSWPLCPSRAGTGLKTTTGVRCARALVALATALHASCAGGRSAEGVAEVYAVEARRASARAPTILFVPGIEGSSLVDPRDGARYWGGWGAGSPDVEDREVVRRLALALGASATAEDDLQPGSPLLGVEVALAGQTVRARGYAGVFEGLLAHLIEPDASVRSDLALPLERIERGDFPIVEHGYDWRRDLTVEAARLHRTILAAVERSRDPDHRVDLVAHSMGGLLVRWYLRYGDAPLADDGALPEVTWAGARFVRRALLVATPNGGATTALAALLDGDQPAWLLPRYPAGLIGTFSSVYMLLPRTDDGSVVWSTTRTPVDLYDVAIWNRLGWGLLDPDQADVLAQLLPEIGDEAARRALARDHLARQLRRAARFHAALDRPATPPPSLHIHLFVGDDIPTEAALAVHPATGERTRLQLAPGDGRVTRRSVLLDRRAVSAPGRLHPVSDWRSVHFVSADHMGIVANPTFLDDALFLLLDAADPPPASPSGD